MAELKQDVVVLKADVSELKQDVATLKADVTELKIDVATLKADVARMDQNMATKSDLERQFNKTMVGGIALASLLFTALRLFG